MKFEQGKRYVHPEYTEARVFIYLDEHNENCWFWDTLKKEPVLIKKDEHKDFMEYKSPRRFTLCLTKEGAVYFPELVPTGVDVEKINVVEVFL